MPNGYKFNRAKYEARKAAKSGLKDKLPNANSNKAMRESISLLAKVVGIDVPIND